MLKYIILDFGGVIAGPIIKGNWDITSKLLELVDVSKIDKDMFKEVRKKYGFCLYV